jgi:hypothetical protein
VVVAPAREAAAASRSRSVIDAVLVDDWRLHCVTDVSAADGTALVPTNRMLSTAR